MCMNHAMKYISRKRILNIQKLLKKKPTIETYCEVYDTNVPWYRQKQIIWRETKAFEFSHWVDVTDPNMNLDCHSFLTVNFEVDFADDETERAYQEHVKEMLEELPEYCRKAEKLVKIIKKVDTNKQTFYRQMAIMKLVSIIVMVSVSSSFLIYFVFRKKLLKRFWKRVTIKKLVTSKNIEVLL